MEKKTGRPFRRINNEAEFAGGAMSIYMDRILLAEKQGEYFAMHFVEEDLQDLVLRYVGKISSTITIYHPEGLLAFQCRKKEIRSHILFAECPLRAMIHGFERHFWTPCRNFYRVPQFDEMLRGDVQNIANGICRACGNGR